MGLQDSVGLGRLGQEQLSCRGETKWQRSPTQSVTSANTRLGNRCQGPLPTLFELLSLPESLPPILPQSPHPLREEMVRGREGSCSQQLCPNPPGCGACRTGGMTDEGWELGSGKSRGGGRGLQASAVRAVQAGPAGGPGQQAWLPLGDAVGMLQITPSQGAELVAVGTAGRGSRPERWKEGAEATNQQV